MSLLTVRGGKLLLNALNHVIPYIEMCTSLVCNQVLFRLGQKGEAIQVSSGSGQLLLADIIKVEKMHPSDQQVWDKVDVFFKVLKKEIEVLYLREKFPVTTHPIIFQGRSPLQKLLTSLTHTLTHRQKVSLLIFLFIFLIYILRNASPHLFSLEIFLAETSSQYNSSVKTTKVFKLHQDGFVGHCQHFSHFST